MRGKDVLDFVVIGAQKAGTTSLFEYLRSHPEVCLPAGKEAPYFSHDALYERGWEAYLRKLAFADPARKWGTMTTHYMAGGVYQFDEADTAKASGYDERTVPLRIREQLPDVRLIAILRDPVQRAISHFRMTTMEGRERRPAEELFKKQLEPEMLDHARRCPREWNSHVVCGEYGRVLGGYLDVFPREQLLVTFTAELERDPSALLTRVEEFIGVSTDYEPGNLGERYRVGSDERRFAWLGPYSPLSPQRLQAALTSNPRTRAAWHMIPEGVQRRVRHPYERFAFRLSLWNRRTGPATNTGDAAKVSEETLARLREHYAQDTERLIALTGVTPPWCAPVGSNAASA